MITITLHDNTHGTELDRERIAALAARTDWGSLDELWNVLSESLLSGFGGDREWLVYPEYVILSDDTQGCVKIELRHLDDLVLTAVNTAEEMTFEKFAAEIGLESLTKEQLLRALLDAAGTINSEFGGYYFRSDGMTPDQQEAERRIDRVKRGA